MNKPASPRPQPQQRRSAETVAKILETAALLLDEVGFDKLTTNLICDRAGLTPPALYRHFRNKYMVMEELARRLMEAQNNSLYGLLEEDPRPIPPRAALAEIVHKQFEVTSQFPGGRWIMRLMHATPDLIHVRLDTHNAAALDLYSRHIALDPTAGSRRLVQAYRLAVEMGYSSMELMLDQRELDPAAISAEAALMIESLLSDASAPERAA